MRDSSLHRIGSPGLVIFAALAAFVLGASGVVFAGEMRFITPIRFTPFTEELPIPPDVEPVAAFEPRCSLQVTGLNPPKFYEVRMQEAVTQIIPGVNTTIFGYDGLYPGPTFRATHNEPAIVRFHNDLSVLTIVHNHGGHTPSQSDGSASVVPEQLIPSEEFRDFCYPNIAPIDPETGEQDVSDFSSTQWYHDHAHDPVLDLGLTGENVYRGLAGFYLLTDELEQGLIEDGVLPSEEFDIPVVFQDRVFAADGSLIFDPRDMDGVLGDVFVVNGKAQPRFTVQRRKYRFRFLNGANARFFEFRLTSGQFVQIGADSWLLPNAVLPTSSDENGRRVNTIQLAPAERADVIIDFRNAPAEVFLENILVQDDGRRPGEVVIPGVPILKFVVQGDPVAEDVTVEVGTPLRPHTPILADEIVRTRLFEFERTGGRWAVNDQFFDPLRNDAVPRGNTAERWILMNGGGGWAHPIHIHLEAHQLQSLSERPLDPQERFKKDTVRLGPGETAEVFMKFRTFNGRYVFHCHNIEHEDEAMMGTFDVRP